MMNQVWLLGLVKRRMRVRLFCTLEDTKRRNSLGRNSSKSRQNMQKFLKTATRSEIERFKDGQRKQEKSMVSQAIREINRSDNFERAKAIFKKSQENALVDSTLYSTFLQACVKFNEAEYGEALFEKLVDNDLEPNEVIYHQMMNLYGKRGAVDAAIQVYDDMVKDDILPNEQIMNTMVSICGKNKRLEQAQEFYNEMIRLELDPTEVTFSSLLTGCVQEKRYDTAKEVVAEMENWECPLNEVNFSQLMKICSSNGDINEVLELMTKMIQNGITPRVATFNQLLEALHSVRDYDHMEMYFEVMLEFGITPNPKTCRLMLHLYDDQQRMEEMLRVRKIMEKLNVPIDHTVQVFFQKALERTHK